MTEARASITYSSHDSEGQRGIMVWFRYHSRGYTLGYDGEFTVYNYTPADDVDVTELPPPNYVRWTEEARYHGNRSS